MGCGSSKAVAPSAAGAAAASPLKDDQASAPQTDVAALHKQRLEQQHSQNAQSQQKAQPQGELCLPGRIESTTAPAPPPLLKELPEVVDLPPLRKGPTSAAADAEFDYDRELKKGAALGGAGSVPTGTAGQGAVDGGLLSKQPDWLRGSSTDPAATTDPAKPAVPTPAQTTPASKVTSSLPPLVGRGMGAPAAPGNLPPLFSGGSRGLAPLDSQHKQQESPSAGASGLSAAAAGGAVAQDEDEKDSLQKQAVPAAQASSASSKSSASSSRSSSPDQHTASSAAAATPAVAPYAHSHGPDSSDPWNSLQSQYAHAGGSPSPDSMAGMLPPAPVAASSAATGGSVLAAAAGASALPPLHGSSAAAGAASGGSRRVTAQQAVKQQRQSQELVLDADSDGETAEPQQQKPQQHHAEGSLGAAGTIRSSGSFAGKLSAQSSQHSVTSGVPHVAKSGGWGVGSLAGAGTIMVGAESSSSKIPSRKPGAAAAAPAAHDDVFGDDEGVPVLPRGLVPEASSGSNLRGSHSRVRVGAAAAAVAPQETLDVEEFEDEADALIESEMARDGLPADLAAKLAQFEAMGADAGSEDGAGSGADSEGPSIFAMMNNRQGSWRAA